MKVFTFFYNRFSTATTSRALHENGINHKVLIHNHEHLENFKKGATIFGDPVVTGAAKGLAYQRNKALDMMEQGEWAVFMCDDFRKISSLPLNWILSKTNTLPIDLTNQKTFRLKKEHDINLKEMFTLFPKLIEIAESSGVALVGFGLHDNPQNLARKFTTRGLADGRFWLVKKQKFRFDEKAQLIDDVAWTAENLVRNGNVLVLNWLVPYFQRYSAGGFGSTHERIAQRETECRYLVKKYFPLVRFGKKTGWPPNTHIRIYGSNGNVQAVRNRYK
jgi:hypothetical protein